MWVLAVVWEVFGYFVYGGCCVLLLCGCDAMVCVCSCHDLWDNAMELHCLCVC